MTLVRVFTPQSESEITVVTSLLEAHDIPVFVHGRHFGSLLPGLQIGSYNAQGIMVPEECVRDALELLSDFKRDDAGAIPAPQSMKGKRRLAFDQEILRGREHIAAGDLERAFHHLERAHVIGQKFVGAHAQTHWLMFRLEVRRRRVVAAFGQAVRLVLGVIGSAVGVVPVGNTGGSDISMFKRLPIAPDLQEIIDDG